MPRWIPTSSLVLPPCWALWLAAPAAAAQTPLVATGDLVPDVGTVVDVVDGPAVGDLGRWAVHVAVEEGSVLLSDAGPVWVHGDGMPGLPGATFLAPVAYDVTVWGEVALVASMGTTDDETSETGVWLGDDLLAAAGQAAAAAGLPAGSTYVSFDALAVDDAGHVLVRTTVDDAGAERAALVRLAREPGGAVAETLVALEGEPLGLLPGAVAELGGAHQLATGQLSTGESGVALWRVALAHDVEAGWEASVAEVVAEGPADDALVLGEVVLARCGTPSPAGPLWSSFEGAPLALHGADVAYSGLLADGRRLVVQGGAPLVADGDVLPSIDPKAVDLGELAHLEAADGRVAWHAGWDGGSGLFVDQELVVEVGVTEVGGAVVEALDPTLGHPFALDGLGTLTALVPLDDGTEVVARWQVATPAKVTTLVGCSPTSAALQVADGVPTPGAVLQITMDGAQADGAVAFLAFSLLPAPSWPGCGTPLGTAGELLIDVTPPDPIAVMGGTVGWTGEPVLFHVELPEWPLGSDLWLQGVFVDVLGAAPATPLLLTNGLGLNLGT